jgi:hypothetical protein
MKRRQKHQGAGKRALRDSEPVTLWGKLQIWGWIGGIFFVVAMGVHFVTTREQRLHLDTQLRQWQSEYHLTEDQMRRIRVREMTFHGTGDPFFQPAHTWEEVRAHHRLVALEMELAEGRRFFRKQEGVELTS